VAKVRFSRRAEADFDDITSYTVRTWNAAQADWYLTLLDDYCQLWGRTYSVGELDLLLFLRR
jgi:plasmid stabilization system protein ParE